MWIIQSPVHGSIVGIGAAGLLAIVFFVLKAIIGHIVAAWVMRKAAKRARAVAAWKRATGECEAQMLSDVAVCVRCGLTWDMNDDFPPPCKL